MCIYVCVYIYNIYIHRERENVIEIDIENYVLKCFLFLFFYKHSKKFFGGGGERTDEMHLSVFHSVSNRAHGKRSRNCLFSGSVRFQLFFFFWHCMTFTLHDLTNFYVERVTVHRIKINDHSCFHNSWPNSKTNLRARGPPGVSGALRSLRILRIGRIGSADNKKDDAKKC